MLHYTEQFDRVRLDADTLRVSADGAGLAHAAADPAFLETVRRVRQNVLAFQSGLLHRDAVLSVAGSHELRLRYRPMRRVGVMVPGGAAAYPSTLLMTVCPAQAAGVQEIAVVMPPTPNGAYNPDLLAVCHELGVTEVYRVGGAQAVAALAYGVDGHAGRGHDRRPGQPLRRPGQAARLRPGGHRLHRRPERGRRPGRRHGPRPSTSPPT